MADAGFFRGTSSDQDGRFSDKEKKLLKQMKFEDTLDRKINMDKINLDVIKPWITMRINEILGIEDDVVIEYIMSQLEEKTINPKIMQINITGFLNARRAREFMGELWMLLVEADESEDGIPRSLVEKKINEMRKEPRTGNGEAKIEPTPQATDWATRYSSLSGGRYTGPTKEKEVSDDRITRVSPRGGTPPRLRKTSSREGTPPRRRNMKEASARTSPYIGRRLSACLKIQTDVKSDSSMKKAYDDREKERDKEREQRRQQRIEDEKRREEESKRREEERAKRRAEEREREKRREEERAKERERRRAEEKERERRRRRSRSRSRSPVKRRFTEGSSSSRRKRSPSDSSDSDEASRKKKKKRHSRRSSDDDSEYERRSRKEKRSKKHRKGKKKKQRKRTPTPSSSSTSSSSSSSSLSDTE